MIIVFAKAPVPGEAKTRLIPALGECGRRAPACAAHAARAAHRARRALRRGRASRQRAAFVLFRRSNVPFRLQRGRDLGERMHHALSRNPGAILIGADCPELTAADLRQAARWLRGGYEVVLAPAEDGGYALIGARRVSPEMFRGIAWGTSSVYRETRETAERQTLARAAHGLGCRSPRGLAAPQSAPLCFSWSATRSAIRR